MPTPSQTDALLNDLMSRLNRLVETARSEGRDDALAEVRSLVGGASAASSPAKQTGKPRKAAGKGTAKGTAKRTKSGKLRKNPWAGLSDADRLKRVNAIRAGRGLPLKRKL